MIQYRDEEEKEEGEEKRREKNEKRIADSLLFASSLVIMYVCMYVCERGRGLYLPTLTELAIIMREEWEKRAD